MAESDTEMYWEREYHLINNKMKQFHRKAALAREKIYKQVRAISKLARVSLVCEQASERGAVAGKPKPALPAAIC